MAQSTKGRLNYRCPSCFMRDLDIDMFYDSEKQEFYCMVVQTHFHAKYKRSTTTYSGKLTTSVTRICCLV